MVSQSQCHKAMTEEERDRFNLLGCRVAQPRRAKVSTQVRLAEALDISQQMVACYEIGLRRIPVSMLAQPSR